MHIKQLGIAHTYWEDVKRLPGSFNNPTAWAICVYVVTGCIRVRINSPGLYLKSPSSMIDINEILNMQQGKGYVYLFP